MRPGHDLPTPSKLSSQHLRLLDQFEDAWEWGKPLEIERLMQGVGAEDRHPLLLELVHIELERRIKAGEKVGVEGYFARFPELSSDQSVATALIAAEFTLRQRSEPHLSSADYVARFPQW